MPKLAGPCGFIHDLSPIPDQGWVTVRDADLETLVGSERIGGNSGGGQPPEFVRLTGRLYECPDCGRVMWERPGEQGFRIFRPDR